MPKQPSERGPQRPAAHAMRPLRTLALLVALLGVSVSGCKKPTSKHPVRKRTEGTAHLPTPPNLNPAPPPNTYSDGAWSVTGLFNSGDEILGQVVTVRGHIANIHRCPKDETACTRPPHMQLTDVTSLQGRRLLVGGPIEQNPQWTTGQRVDIRGTFVRSSADGRYLAPRGLLMLATTEQAQPTGPGR